VDWAGPCRLVLSAAQPNRSRIVDSSTIEPKTSEIDLDVCKRREADFVFPPVNTHGVESAGFERINFHGHIVRIDQPKMTDLSLRIDFFFHCPIAQGRTRREDFTDPIGSNGNPVGFDARRESFFFPSGRGPHLVHVRRAVLFLDSTPLSRSCVLATVLAVKPIRRR
jgi:hypothetical protein